MMKKSILSILLIISLLAGLLPVLIGSAENTQPADPTGTTTATGTTEATTTTQATGATETTAPSETTAPTGTAAPSETTAPTGTTAPSETTAPTGTTDPSATTAPTGTTDPSETTAPTDTTDPSATTAPTGTTDPAPSTKPTTAPTTKPATTPTVTPTTAPTVAPSFPASDISVSIKLCETSTAQNYLAVLTVKKGGPAVYATTDAAGVPTLVTDGTIPSNNYIKFVYPNGDIPTVTLKGAYLKATGEVLSLSDFDIAVKIVVETDSNIESTFKQGIVRKSHGDLTITGSGKLTLNCYSSAVFFGGDSCPNSLVLKGTTLDATTTNASAAIFHIPAGNLVSDQCTLKLNGKTGLGIFAAKGKVADAHARGNIILTNSKVTVYGKTTGMQADNNISVIGSTVQVTGDARALSAGGDLTVDNATFVLTGNSSTLSVADVSGRFTIRGSIAEFVGANCPVFSASTKPVLIGNFNTLAGIDKGSATPYTETLADSYRYFYAVPVGELPTEPTTEPTTAPTGDPTTEPESAPTTAPTAATVGPTVPAAPPSPTIRQDNDSGGSRVLLWVLAVIMLLGACGTATVAVLMIQKKK